MAGNSFAWSRGPARWDHRGRLGAGPGHGSPRQGATRGSLPPGAVLVVGQHPGGGQDPLDFSLQISGVPCPCHVPQVLGWGAGIRGADSFVPGWKKPGGDVLPPPSPCLRTRWVALSRGDVSAAGVPSPAFPGGADPLLHPYGSSSVSGRCRPPTCSIWLTQPERCRRRCPSLAGQARGGPGVPERGLPGAPHSSCAWALSQLPRCCPDAPALPASHCSALLSAASRALLSRWQWDGDSQACPCPCRWLGWLC